MYPDDYERDEAREDEDDLEAEEGDAEEGDEDEADDDEIRDEAEAALDELYSTECNPSPVRSVADVAEALGVDVPLVRDACFEIDVPRLGVVYAIARSDASEILDELMQLGAIADEEQE